MAARAIWKGIVRFANVRVPVKLYSAVEDHSFHFRLLHGADYTPVRQALVNPQTDAVVPYQETHRSYITGEGPWVMLRPDELAALEPQPARELWVLRFLPPEAIDHRWYLRPYYLGPDNPPGPYFALARALEREGKQALVRWVMRKKEYVGVLRLHQGYPMLVVLRHAEEVVPADALAAPRGPQLDDRELAMARQLMAMLEAPFEPQAYRDEYRARVLELIEAKARGGSVKSKPVPKAPPTRDLTRALEASLKREHANA
ncbi:MAG TPA: Ku protein [Nitrococcus sp.]|nr:Ku protein [Nitrococcus sp.]